MIREAEMEEMEKKWREQNARIMADHPAAEGESAEAGSASAESRTAPAADSPTADKATPPPEDGAQATLPLSKPESE